jgi:hypothetical protein
MIDMTNAMEKEQPELDLDLTSLAIPDQNPEELRDMAEKAKSENNIFAYNKLMDMVAEIENLETLDWMISPKIGDDVAKWMGAPYIRKGIIDRVYKKLARNQKYTFVDMKPLEERLKDIIGDKADLFMAALYSLFAGKTCEQISYFQPRLMCKIRQKDEATIANIKRIADWYTAALPVINRR